ncbi:hypothetical protein TREMEDRAFT_29841, partial [Tremella mesenterica DSM 1558]|uniref:uncharacterized protein n=1 Tax=Tremella mesenterica (strain ATCC 24925 / CBS 8224 / DSM 1558 / NBRC 9311 / NRRL Y-6157 / RJB 2259-6 / UBC 559-6) TaxID=578456 RepID=UPI0003F49765
VAFKLASEDLLSSFVEKFKTLSQNCLDKNGQRYIKSIRGGKQISPEGMDGGMQVVFIVEFDDKEHADYYLDHDSAHADFKKLARAKYQVNGVFCLDFVEGQF